MPRRILLLCLLALMVASPLLARPYAPVQNGPVIEAEDVLPYAADRVLVQFTRDAMARSRLNVSMEKGAGATDGRTDLPAVDAILSAAGARSVERPYTRLDTDRAAASGADRWFMVHAASGDMVALAEDLARTSEIASASPDWRVFPTAVPNDANYDRQWGHDNTGQMVSYDWSTHTHTGPTVGTVGFDAKAEAAWDKSQGYGSSSVVIAILDSGVDIDHPDLNLVAGYDFGDNDTNPDDNSGQPGHGTACAGVAAAIADNGIGVAGIAGGASIMPCKIANSQGSLYLSYVQNALYWAADNGADVISMSFGADISSDAATDAALEYAWNAGCILFAATSNENYSYIGYPANHADVIAVGAASPCGGRKRSAASSLYTNPDTDTDPNDYTCDGERWWGSCYGPDNQDAADAVVVIAPTILPTTDIGGSGGYESGDYSLTFNGTSCATPYAAGVAALVISANPAYTNQQVWDAITSTATDVVNVESGAGWDRYSGYGLVNADAAVGNTGPVPPTAAFSGTPLSGQYPLNVSFTDQSANAPTSWSWTFGDGGTSTAQNPSHTYTAAGTYTVSLTATNAVGSDDEVKTAYITVTAPAAPVAAFTGTPTSGTYPLDVSFTDQSSGSPTSWAWTFGDGGTSTAQNPSHTYTATGTYTVVLTATSPYGSDSETKVGYVTVTEPGVTTYVTASGETAVTGTVNGSYAATAQADNVRQTVTEVQYTGHPRKTYSYLEHRWSFDLPAGGDATFHLEASRTTNGDGDNFAFTYSTDGATWLPLVTVGSATEQAYSVSLGALSGAVTVRVLDTDRNWGNLSFDTVSIDWMAFELGDVQPVAPTADFAGTPTSGEYPLDVQFSDASSGDPTSWSWTFGDGGTSTTQNPSHTYTAAGTFTVSLTVTNAQGSDTATKTGYITVTEPGQGGTTMHVSALSASRYRSGPNYVGTCSVTIVDDNGQPVTNATVTASYTGPNSGTANGVTNASGVATLETSGQKKPSGDWCFDVTNVAHATLNYVSGDNVVSSVCEGAQAQSDGGFMVRELTLGAASPNPFNPMTELSFTLPRAMHARLTVYNARGEVEAVLVNEDRGVGVHRVTWNAKGSPSGIYFSRLVAGDTVLTGKLVLLK